MGERMDEVRLEEYFLGFLKSSMARARTLFCSFTCRSNFTSSSPTINDETTIAPIVINHNNNVSPIPLSRRGSNKPPSSPGNLPPSPPRNRPRIQRYPIPPNPPPTLHSSFQGVIPPIFFFICAVVSLLVLLSRIALPRRIFGVLPKVEFHSPIKLMSINYRVAMRGQAGWWNGSLSLDDRNVGCKLRTVLTCPSSRCSTTLSAP